MIKMIHPSTKLSLTTLGIITGVFLAGCSPQGNHTEATMENSLLDTSLILPSPLEPTHTIPELSSSTLPEDTSVVLQGRIGGTLKPFTDGFAVFVLADEAVMFCDEMGDDHCPTPWDACCEDPAKLKIHRLTVQFTDETGFPLNQSLQGWNGLSENQTVTVKGNIQRQADGHPLLIATGIRPRD